MSNCYSASQGKIDTAQKVYVVHHNTLSDSFWIRIVWFQPKQYSDRIQISFFKNRIGSVSKNQLSDHLWKTHPIENQKNTKYQNFSERAPSFYIRLARVGGSPPYPHQLCHWLRPFQKFRLLNVKWMKFGCQHFCSELAINRPTNHGAQQELCFNKSFKRNCTISTGIPHLGVWWKYDPNGLPESDKKIRL